MRPGPDLFETADASALRASLAALDVAARALAEAQKTVEAALRGDVAGDELLDFNDTKRWLTIAQAAHALRLSESTVRRHAREWGVKVGGVWRIDLMKATRGRGRK